jgi:transposase-like protein
MCVLTRRTYMLIESAEDVRRKLRREIEECGPRSPARRFPEELKARVGKWVAQRREEGMGAKEAAEVLGVPWETLSRWCARGTKGGPRQSREAPGGGLRPVAFVDGAALGVAAGLTLRTPKGFTLEGLTVATAVELLGRLS